MKVVLCLLGIVGLVCSNPVVSNNAALRQVGSSYADGLTAFKSIIDQLINREVLNTTPAQKTAWAVQLQKDAIAMDNGFVNANDKLEVENDRLDKLSDDLAAKTGAIEKGVTAKLKRVSGAQAQLNKANNNVALNERNLRNAEANLASAERALASANEKLRKARSDCIGRKRRKRGIGSFLKKAVRRITRPVEKVVKKVLKPIEKVICRSIDLFTNSVKRAKRNRNKVESNRNRFRNSLVAARKQQATANRQLATARTQLSAAKQQVAKTRAQLAGVQAQLGSTTAMVESVKSVIEHLDKVTVGSRTLKDFIADLELLMVNLDVVLVPLNHISDQLTAQNIQGVVLTKIPVLTAEQKAHIVTSLQLLRDNLED